MVDYSFVIPAYNNKKQLCNCLEALNKLLAVEKQTYEAIVIDDGSDDSLYRYIRDIPRQYRLHYKYLTRNSDSCRARTRNAGWQQARGSLIIFLDSDILVRPDYLSEINKCFHYGLNQLVVGMRIMIPEPVNSTEIIDGSVFEKYQFLQDDPRRWEIRHRIFNSFSHNMSCYKYPWLFVHSHNMVVPRYWLNKVNGFDEGFKGWGHEDIELGYRLQQEELKIVLNTNMEVLHQYHSSPVRDDVDNGFMKDLERNCRYFLDKHPALFDLPYTEALEVLKGNLIINPSVNNDRPRESNEITRHVVDYHSRNDFEKVKARIKKICQLDKCEVIINDYTGESDLQLWVQYLEKIKNVPSYFPVGKILINNEPINQIR